MKSQRLFVIWSLMIMTLSLHATIYSGSCGDNLQWEVNTNTGILEITGAGAMYNYSYTGAPWNTRPNACSEYVKTIHLPEGLTYIGIFAFRTCYNTVAVSFPNSLIEIGRDAFSSCYNLAAITLPNHLEKVGEGAFAYCDALTEVSIPASVLTIDAGAFCSCKNLQHINVNDQNKNYCDIDGILFNIDTTAILQYPAGNVASSYTIPATIKTIGEDAFLACTNLSELNIPNSVTEIGPLAFSRCNQLTSITIPQGVKTIQNGTFSDCTSLISIVLPDYIDSINWTAFYNDERLESIILPKTLKFIGGQVFRGCTGLKSMTCKAKVPPTIADQYTFIDITKSIPVYVPASSVAAYKAAEQWKDFTNIQAIDGSDDVNDDLNNDEQDPVPPENTRPIYLNTGGFWWGNNDNYYIYAWKDANNPVNVKMEYVADFLYRAYIDKDCTNAYFYYLSADDTFTTIDDVWAGYKTQTTIPIDKDLYTITSSWMGVWSAVEFGEWSNYDAAKSSVSFAYGQTGEVEYAVKRDSTLEITGSGAMEHYATHQISEDPTFQDPRRYWSPWYCWEYVIKSISLPEGLTTIGAYAFEYTPDVTSVTIPSTVRIIGSGAFNAQNFRFIICKAVTPPTIAARTSNEEYKHFFQNVDYSIPLFVPDASVSAYQKAEYWKDFTNIIPLSTIPDDEDDYDADAERSKAVMPEAIDLGLPSGMRWSNMNLGATRPDDYGKLYQWGCVTPVTREGWDIYCHGTENQLTKYCTNSNYGLVDNLTTLEPEDDAAVQGWGNGWRLPTKEEAQELWDNCTKTKEERNGVAGYVFTGPNGNSIFLPMVGWLDENGELQERNTGGRYWTSSLWDSYNNGAYGIGIAEGDILSSGVLPGMTNRYYCRAIRGVLPARTCHVNTEFNVSLDEGNTFTYSGITVTPNAGQHDYSVTLLSAAGCDSTVTWHVTVKASATIEQYTINVQANDARFGTVSGGGTYTKGTVITLTATPAAGCLFVKWSDGNALNPRALYVSTTATYTAIFKPVKSSNAGETGGKSYDEKSGVVDPWSDSSGPVSPVIGKEANKVEETEITTPAQKVFVNGQLLIIRDGRTYNAQGARVK